MMENVKKALVQQKEFYAEAGIECTARVDGYTDFIFLNRNGNVHNQGTLNKALKRIMRDCNDEILMKNPGGKNLVLLPRFSCHVFRHTFTTRMIESGINLKVVQDVLGHSDISTTMDIYAFVTKDLKVREFTTLDEFWNKQLVV